ncbi:MAG TPA: hypothetical protein VIL64_00165, partial [Solirubrobacteraceae bacterium]
GHAQLALSADTAPATLTLRSRSLDAYCKEPKRPKPGAGGTPASHLVASGAVGATGTTSGDCSIHHGTVSATLNSAPQGGGTTEMVAGTWSCKLDRYATR